MKQHRGVLAIAAGLALALGNQHLAAQDGPWWLSGQHSEADDKPRRYKKENFQPTSILIRQSGEQTQAPSREVSTPPTWTKLQGDSSAKPVSSQAGVSSTPTSSTTAPAPKPQKRAIIADGHLDGSTVEAAPKVEVSKKENIEWPSFQWPKLQWPEGQAKTTKTPRFVQRSKAEGWRDAPLLMREVEADPEISKEEQDNRRLFDLWKKRNNPKWNRFFSVGYHREIVKKPSKTTPFTIRLKDDKKGPRRQAP